MPTQKTMTSSKNIKAKKPTRKANPATKASGLTKPVKSKDAKALLQSAKTKWQAVVKQAKALEKAGQAKIKALTKKTTEQVKRVQQKAKSLEKAFWQLQKTTSNQKSASGATPGKSKVVKKAAASAVQTVKTKHKKNRLSVTANVKTANVGKAKTSKPTNTNKTTKEDTPTRIATTKAEAAMTMPAEKESFNEANK